ncbi:hypothetical protein NITMOv2_0381 [Nitrospira moscoviensis]|uniref:Uncharacterized protein n=1 Tax=Nitrospira moscoviensis TaxID=42253 RepID=A0A0K2G887_NITMO|nr:hypothetical protein NITMOv2_0381 [Nitrospira moscoviensis]
MPIHSYGSYYARLPRERCHSPSQEEGSVSYSDVGGSNLSRALDCAMTLDSSEGWSLKPSGGVSCETPIQIPTPEEFCGV